MTSPPVELAKFPYPYEAAFTVASDIDSGSPMRFRGIHSLFCGHELISKGSPEWQALGLTADCSRFDKDRDGVPGLGLELSDSFFLIGDPTTFGMYRYAQGEDLFREDEQEGENCASLIRDWIRGGQIDTFHTFLHYTREQVAPLLKRFYDWCERENVAKPRVWSNHARAFAPSGLCPRRLHPNRVNRLVRLLALQVLAPILHRPRKPLRYAFARYQGDTPGSPFYISDLLAANGLRYVWLSAGPCRPNQIALSEDLQNGRPTILRTVTMDDGLRFYAFERCYGTPQPTVSGTAYLRDSDQGFDSSVLINEKNLEQLCRCNGTCIFYTHWTHFRSMPISNQTLGRFELLQRWHQAGRIWVTSTSRLLEWTRRRTFLTTEYHQEGRHLVLDIKEVADPVFGRERLTPEELNGVCFHRLSSNLEIRLAINGQVLPQDQVGRSGDLCWVKTADFCYQEQRDVVKAA